MARSMLRRLGLPLAAGLLVVAAAAAQPRTPLPTWPVDPAALAQPISMNRGYGRLRGPRLMPPMGVEGFLMQGHALLATASWVDAARSFNAALRITPTSVPAWLGLSVALHALGDRDQARQALETARRLAGALDPRDRSVALVDLWTRYRDWSEGPAAVREAGRGALIGALDALLAADPADADRWVLRAGMEAATDALPFLKAALVRQPEHLGAQALLARAYEDSGDLANAERHAAAVVRLAPMVASARLALAHVLTRRHDWLAARGALLAGEVIERQRQATENIPPGEDATFSRLLQLRALVEWRLGHRSAAEALVKEAAALVVRGPSHGLAEAAWTDWLLLDGRLDDALAVARAPRAAHDAFAVVVDAALDTQVRASRGDLPGADAALATARTAQRALDDGWSALALDDWRAEASDRVALAAVWVAVARAEANAGPDAVALLNDRIARPRHPWLADLLRIVALERLAETRMPDVAAALRDRRLTAGWETSSARGDAGARHLNPDLRAPRARRPAGRRRPGP